MQRLNGKVAIITGGAQGIGFAAVKKFAAEGAQVVIWDVNQEKGQQALAELKQHNLYADFQKVDVTQFEFTGKVAEIDHADASKWLDHATPPGTSALIGGNPMRYAAYRRRPAKPIGRPPFGDAAADRRRRQGPVPRISRGSAGAQITSLMMSTSRRLTSEAIRVGEVLRPPA